jgi:hypothetical protein
VGEASGDAPSSLLVADGDPVSLPVEAGAGSLLEHPLSTSAAAVRTVAERVMVVRRARTVVSPISGPAEGAGPQRL